MNPRLPRAAAVLALILGASAAAATSPATAAVPTDCSTAPYGALASADLIALRLADVRPLGLGLGPVVDVRVAASRVGWTGDQSAAGARYLDARLLGQSVPAPVLNAHVQQSAPPTASGPATASVFRQNLGLVAVGVGEASARARSRAGLGCGTAPGPVADASAALVDATVLGGSDGHGLVRITRNLSSRTTAESKDGAAQAAASISLTDVRLFAGSASAVRVEVLSPPTLRVTATGGKPSVDYSSPVLRVTGPVIGTRQLSSPATSFEFAVPPAVGTAGAVGAAAAHGLPLLTGNPLGDVVGAVDPAKAAKLAGPAAPLGDLLKLPGLPSLPRLPGPLGQVGESLPVLGNGALVKVRVSIGDLEQAVTGTAVRARAASLRLELIALVGRTEVTLVDLGIGLLEASATAPARPPAGDPGCGGPGCGGGGSLPVTGTKVGIIAGGALLLVVAGRFLLLLGRRQDPVA